jgi:hypothetical protein
VKAVRTFRRARRHTLVSGPQVMSKARPIAPRVVAPVKGRSEGIADFHFLTAPRGAGQARQFAFIFVVAEDED